MQSLYTDEQLYAMPASELAQLVNAAWTMLEAHKTYVHHNHCLAQFIHLDSELTNTWYHLFGIMIDRHVQIKRVWSAIFTAVSETKTDNDKTIGSIWRTVSKVALMSDTATMQDRMNLDAYDYVIDRIWKASDQPTIDVKTFIKQYRQRKTDTARIKLCQRWAQVSYQFGLPDFKQGK